VALLDSISRRRLVAATVAALAVILPVPVAAQDGPAAAEPESATLAVLGYLGDRHGNVTSIDPPGSEATKPGDINNRGQVVGTGYPVMTVTALGLEPPASASSRRTCPDGSTSVYDRPAPGDNGAYILEDGELRTFTFPGAVTGGPSDINDRGDVVGPYTDAAGIQHGFQVDRRGCLVTLDYPGPPRSKNEAVGINDRGQIVGVYGQYGDETTGESHAYVRGRRGFSSYDVPGALATGAFKNNDRGQIVGVYSNQSRDRVGTADAHGFLLDDGELERIDAPGAALTFLFDINDRGQILGVGANADNTAGFGFIRDRGGAYTRLPDVPGALTTIPLGLNNRGQVVGVYLGGDGTQHGYLLDRGQFTTIDVPGAAATDAFGINDRGQIVGAFSNTPPPSALSPMDAGPAAMPEIAP
jgi:uncharacterized membrane protein